MNNEMKKDININNLTDEIKLIDIAKTLDDYDDNQILKLCSALTDEKLALILEQTDEASQKRLINFLTDEKIIKIFSFMQKDDIVDILGILNIGKTKNLINKMKEGDRNTIRELLGYKDDTAGGIMTTEYISLNGKLTVQNALKKIKELSPKTELIDTIFVLNNEKKLSGIVDLRDILISEDNKTLNDIADTNFKYVEPELDQEDVANIASKYDLNVIPVVDKKMSMLGIITIDAIMDVISEEQTEDVLKMGGIAKVETLDSKFLESLKLRFPWLLVNLITAFIASLTVKAFEGTISQVVALSAIMSIVTGMGGNAGTQTVSIIIRNIAMGNVELKDAWHLLEKEILLGLVNGIGIGLITGIVVYFIYGNVYLGVIILLAIIGNLILAGISGILIPLILDKMHIDPALSSSIFLTTVTDTLGFFIFLSLAKIFLPLLV